MRVSLVVAFVVRCSIAVGSMEGTTTVGSSIENPVLALNSQIFDGNVLNPSYVREWLVLYCVSWAGECGGSELEFRRVAGHGQKTYNKDLLMDEVRFAYVDCAKEKPLCNRMGVRRYPQVGRYVAGKPQEGPSAFWNGVLTDSNKKQAFEFWALAPVRKRTLPMSRGDSFPEIWEGIRNAFNAKMEAVKPESVDRRSVTGALFIVFVTGFLFYFNSLLQAQAPCGGTFPSSSTQNETAGTLMPSASPVSAQSVAPRLSGPAPSMDL